MSAREENATALLHSKEATPESAVPYVQVGWTELELASLAKLASSEPVKPTDALIRAMKGRPAATVDGDHQQHPAPISESI